ncbi:MAG: flap endonuclease [Thermoplasmata archaeon]|nr:flap endonuclease [Thermoplasmata archaeon]
MMSRRRPPGDVGIAALRKILPPAPFDVAQLKGKTVAVDADNLVWSFVTALAGAGELPKAPDGRSNAHLLGLLSRLSLYAKWGARSVWVFDGVQPDLKEATLIERGERIEAARVAGDNYQASVAVDEDDLEECRTLLTALGQPWIVAPGESDAQCAHLVQAEKAWAAVTQDWDIALFGAPRALRNLTLSATRTPEILDLAVVLKTAGLTREQLVDAAILIGTDYNEGVSGVGPVKAVKLVKQGKKPEESGIANADEVRALYFAHPVDKKFTPKFGKPDAKATLAFLTRRGIDEKRGRDLLELLAA